MNLLVFWLVLAAIFFVLEIITPGALVSVWFAAGALAAAIGALCSLPLLAQAGIFLVFSSVLLFLTRPLARRLHNQESPDFGSPALIGRQGKLLEPVDREKGTGLIRLDGTTWRCMSSDGEPIDMNRMVTVMKIDGNKLVVTDNDKLSYTI